MIEISTKKFLGVEKVDKDGGILKIFFRGNKKTVTVMKVLISKDHHHCFSCPYNIECNRTCTWLESNVNVLVGVRSVYSGLLKFKITPLYITWTRSKSYPSTIASNPYTRVGK